MKSIFIYLMFFILSIYSVYSIEYTDEQKAAFVQAINDVRRNANPPATNMRQISYSDCLTDVANEYVMSCPEKDDRNPDLQEQAEAAGCVPSGATVGSAVYNTNDVNPFTLWAAEDYDYNSNTCGEGICDNFLQLMNAESYLIGCATNQDRANCEDPGYSTFHCYFINAAKEGERPYIAGDPCAGCEGEWSGCDNSLCIEMAAPTESTTQPQVTTPQVTTPQVTTPQVNTPQVTTPQVNTPHCHHNHGHHNSHNHDHDLSPKPPKSDKPHDHGDGHKSHDHNHGKKHDHAHNHGDGDMNGQMSVGHLAGSSSSSASINKIAILLLIASLFAFIFSSL